MSDSNQKKKIVGGLIVIVCLIGAVLAFTLQSGGSSPGPEVKQVEQHADAIQKSVQTQPNAQEVPYNPTSPRGRASPAK